MEQASRNTVKTLFFPDDDTLCYLSDDDIVYLKHGVTSGIRIYGALKGFQEHRSKDICVCSFFSFFKESSGSEVECLTRDRGAAGSSLTGVTALWSFLSKTHLS